MPALSLQRSDWPPGDGDLLMWSRRAALGGLAAGLAVGARAAELGSVRLVAGQLTQGGWARGLCGAGAQGLTLDGAQVPLSADGGFFIAFDRDAGPVAQLTLTMGNGGKIAQALNIMPRQWQIEHIDAPFHPPAIPDEAFARIRKDELARIAAARATDTGATGWRQGFVWPAPGRVSGRFGAQRVFRGTAGTYHAGLDIAAGAGTPYVAPADGAVVLAAEQPFTLEGHLLLVDHGMGLNSAFLHASRLLVSVGDRVRQGQPLGEVGMTGRATGPHLHWGMRWREARLDPLLFVSARG